MPNFSNINFQYRWLVQDQLVGTSGISRPYTWGPSVVGAASSLYEAYVNSPGGMRLVQYFDKARMELNIPVSGGVTSGLLVKELVSGSRQDGDNTFATLEPSQTQVAGDPVVANPDTPVYASFKNVVTLGGADAKSKPNAVGSNINQFIAKDGSTKTITPPETLTIGTYQPETGHNIAAPFHAFQNLQGTTVNPVSGQPVPNQPIYTTNPTSNVFGFAVSEPYWVQTKIVGATQTVLVQLFERRVLTYNPALAGVGVQKVEMGNLGQHYYHWRYIENNATTG